MLIKSFPDNRAHLIKYKPALKSSDLSISFRFIKLAVRFSPLFLTSPILSIPSITLKSMWFKQLVNTCEKCGPCFVKVIQYASSRRDLYPAYVCDIFSKMQDKVTPHSYSYTVKTFKNDLGINIKDVFVNDLVFKYLYSN